MIKANLLFMIAAFHPYYSDEICRCIRFKPGPVTADLQSKYGFLLRNTGNGFDLYANNSGNPSSLLNYIINTTGYSFFDFVFETTDPAFYLFTALPADWKGELTYDSRYTKPVPGTNKIKLTEQLTENKSIQAAGNIQIHFNDLIPFLNTNTVVEYNIRFTARVTQWQYFIVNKNAVPLSNPFIKGNVDFEFEGPETISIPSGQEALFFNSGKHLLPLCEKPGYKFSLLDHTGKDQIITPKSTRNKTVLRSLPSPDPSRFEFVEIDGSKQFSSPMYIYI